MSSEAQGLLPWRREGTKGPRKVLPTHEAKNGTDSNRNSGHILCVALAKTLTYSEWLLVSLACSQCSTRLSLLHLLQATRA